MVGSLVEKILVSNTNIPSHPVEAKGGVDGKRVKNLGHKSLFYSQVQHTHMSDKQDLSQSKQAAK